ncbi:MAG: translation initiation factor IF-2, partial [Desulfobacterales bacterium]|nr:translation initiation factor IF-2 [Desulfobacterales bacterium]
MAKIRVYELARELSLTNKALMQKLVGLEISVASHMSSLDDDAVRRIKAALFGKKAGVQDETRVKPTVIRRRKKIAETPAEAPAEEAAPEAEPETAAAAEAEAHPAADAEAAPPAAAEVAAEPAEEAEPSEPAESPAPETPAAAAERMPAAEAAPAPVEELKRPGPIVRKMKRDEPAKIIKLPPTPVPQPSEGPSAKPALVTPPRSRTAPAPAEVVPVPAETDGRDDKKRKKKSKAEEAEAGKKFIKKKISFRTKAVVEADELYDDVRARKPRKGGKAQKEIAAHKPQITVAKAIKRRIKMDETIMVSDLAKRMGVKAGEIIKVLMGMGVMASVNQAIDFETATLVAAEFQYEVERSSFAEDNLIQSVADAPEALLPRAPVVTIMGHVDHGKTSLLDVIRKTRVTDTEAGGITQHIGAYHVRTDRGSIAFLDTPGHEAFTAMRARGARVTDIVVLVVAADDGVMPQTVEAINHARAANVPIIVAVNKIDKPGADPERTRRSLVEHGLAPEEWGGETIFVNVSAKQATGIDQLLEMILLQAEVMELKANPDKLARGHVVEAKIDSGRGPVATVLVSEGTLRAGDAVVCGVHHGKIRAMLDDRGQALQTAGPSVPVEVLGLAGVPMAGDEFMAVPDERAAKQISEHRMQKQRSRDLTQASARPSLESLFERLQQGGTKELNLIIKADVHGSIEALSDALVKLSNAEVKVNVVHAATGTISESDVSLAAVSHAIIIGFNVRPTSKVQALAAEEKVDMRFYNVIYDVINDVKGALTGMMASRFEEHILGSAEVREVFHIPKVGTVAGSYVTDGKIERGRSLRLIRDGVVVFEGRNSSLRRFKDDAKEVPSGYECGIGIENFNDIKVGDRIEFYYME